MRPLFAVLLLVASAAHAFDHFDGPRVVSNPVGDLTDLFAWVSADANTVNLALTVDPSATSTSSFGPTVQYAFHIESMTAFGVSAVKSTTLICTFDALQQISCWLGADRVISGDASSPLGLSNAGGTFKVFAGPRKDPAFANTQGLRDFRAALIAGAYDQSVCPTIAPGDRAALLNLLKGSSSGAPVNAFASSHVLALVISLDKRLLTAGGDIVSVWASTHQAP